MKGRSADELLATLYREHGDALTRYVRHLTQNGQSVDDVVQETMVRAWQRPAVLERTPDGARAWLFTVARNLVVDDARSARHRHEYGMEQPVDRAEFDHTNAVLDRIVVADALASLTPDHRRVVVDAYWLGHTVPEIARRHDIPEGTAKSRLHYGLRALRLALQERGVTR
ncbi:sigma-70 family RNA polymerase sigma factor [Curtobacterium sp. SORGH_AS_0776]|uniref:sigma-70 family RNA polymerase sigma factor n=1 Tax=Curtobacterium sp. SORGH_AS_0776 TaxID=3041798 RepID=UPI00285AB297|nr:sigma-70 family RNA polymerase sigma factor [Curtobacterium sp. SORGH_AS_0776]MDR6170424.1 RNA polymerase sigma-70 factor (ECF subfamily) [Curtobacterium sp. SORGH_AS_0776]